MCNAVPETVIHKLVLKIDLTNNKKYKMQNYHSLTRISLNVNNNFIINSLALEFGCESCDVIDQIYFYPLAKCDVRTQQPLTKVFRFRIRFVLC